MSTSAENTPQSQVVHFSATTRSGHSSGTSSKYPGLPVRKYTPYNKTPKSRRLGVRWKNVSGIRTPVQVTDTPELKDLVNKTWKVYKLSPLYNFSHRTTQLRSYARLLSAHIEAESLKGVAIGVNENEVADKVHISTFKGLAVSDADAEAVEIILKSKPKTGNGEPKVSLTAYLCSVGVDPETKSLMKSAFTYLPVMIVKGAVGLTGHLISWLQSQFDCHITPMSFCASDLSWVLATWAGYGREEGGTKPVELVYTVPKECEGLNTITMTIQATDCKDLWDCIHDSENEEFTIEEVVRFMKSIEAHFYHHFKIYLSALALKRVGTSIAMLGTEGRLKIFLKEHIHRVLQHVTELAFEQLDLP